MRPFGATILDATGHRLSVEEKAFFRDVRPFGFILFARNIDSPDQVRALCDEMREAAGHEAVITIDQEGGRVQRMRAPQWRDWMPPMELAARAGEQATKAFTLMYRIIAHELYSVGIDSNCAPLIDVAGPKTHPFLRNRCYGETPGQVAEIGRAVADALLAGGVLPVMKHMPGHGRATCDSHKELPHVAASDAELEVDIEPFRTLAAHPLGMSAHIVFEAWDATVPTTLSETVVRDIIRGRIGFDGLLLTDDIDMQALDGTIAERSRRALAAGCDIVLNCWARMEDQQAIADLGKTMSDQSARRLERVHAAMHPPSDGPDTDELLAKRDALLALAEKRAA